MSASPFVNGASVSRIWGDHEEAELLAVFQYSNDAEDFARERLVKDAENSLKGSSYAVVCCYSAKLKILRSQQAKATGGNHA